MNSDNKDKKNLTDTYIYDCLEYLPEETEKNKLISQDLNERLEELFESIDDEECTKILADMINVSKFLSKIDNLAHNEFLEIKDNSEQLIEKYEKHKDKIKNLKCEIDCLKKDNENANEQIDKYIKRIDELGKECLELYQEKQNFEKRKSIMENEENRLQKLTNDQLNQEIVNLQATNNSLLGRINELKTKFDELSAKNKQMNTENAYLIKSITYTNRKYNEETYKNEKYERECKRLIEENNKLKSDNIDLIAQREEYKNLIELLQEKCQNDIDNKKDLATIQKNQNYNLEDLENEEKKNSENIENNKKNEISINNNDEDIIVENQRMQTLGDLLEEGSDYDEQINSRKSSNINNNNNIINENEKLDMKSSNSKVVENEKLNINNEIESQIEKRRERNKKLTKKIKVSFYRIKKKTVVYENDEKRENVSEKHERKIDSARKMRKTKTLKYVIDQEDNKENNKNNDDENYDIYDNNKKNPRRSIKGVPNLILSKILQYQSVFGDEDNWSSRRPKQSERRLAHIDHDYFWNFDFYLCLFFLLKKNRIIFGSD